MAPSYSPLNDTGTLDISISPPCTPLGPAICIGTLTVSLPSTLQRYQLF
jgi:hypothetical protein